MALAAAASAQDPAVEKSRELFLKVCSTCHKPENALATRRTKEQWREMVDLMVAEGLKSPDKDLSAVLEFLVGQYGRVNVNRAQAGEISEVLSLTAEEAEAIVKYRKDSGKFEDFDALAKVPGVDLKKLEKARDAISF